MKTTRFSGADTSDEPRLDMSPLIDLSFLLLVYFLATSTLLPKESDLAMTLPVDPRSNSIPVVIDHMEIEIDPRGQIVLDGIVIEHDSQSRILPKLLDRLVTYRESANILRVEPVVVIAAADESKGQRFVDVLNTLAHPKVRIEKVTLKGFLN